MREIARMLKSFWLLFTSNKVAVLVGDPLFRFDSYLHWSGDAAELFELWNKEAEEVLCLDTHGRVCSLGKHFRRAEEEGSYPIIAYEVL